MNPWFYQLMTDMLKKNSEKKGQKSEVPPRIMADAMHVFKVEVTHFIRNSLFIVLGVFSTGFGLKGFLLPNTFFDGGITGISLIVEPLSGISLSILLIAINLPFLLLGGWTISRQFAVRSVVAIILLALAVQFVPFPIITEDKLLIALFGGFFLGMGFGLSMRGGAAIDGTEVLAVYLSQKTRLSIGGVILIFNIFIFSVGAYLLSIETALYAMLTYIAAFKTIDFVIDGIEEYIGVTIISLYSEDIRNTITEKLGRGYTVYVGKRGHGKRGDMRNSNIIYTVITRLELAELKKEIEKIDPEAFIVMSSIKDTKGGMVKKRVLHK